MDNLPAKAPDSDISERDMEKVKQFMAEGMPGLAKLKETDFFRMVEMYMNGCTYHQIGSSLHLSKPLVLYISHTYGWYIAKQEYLEELQERIKRRILDSKLESQDFLLLYVSAYQKKLSKKLKSYLVSDDEAKINDINHKDVDKLIKAIETIHTLDSLGKRGEKGPAVGLNLGDGVTIERSGDNKVTITPALDKQLGSMLKKFADDRRAEESKKNDIKNNKEEQNNET